MVHIKQINFNHTKNSMVGLPKNDKARQVAQKVMRSTGLDKKNLKELQRCKNKPLSMPYLQH